MHSFFSVGKYARRECCALANCFISTVFMISDTHKHTNNRRDNVGWTTYLDIIILRLVINSRWSSPNGDFKRVSLKLGLSLLRIYLNSLAGLGSKHMGGMKHTSMHDFGLFLQYCDVGDTLAM